MKEYPLAVKLRQAIGRKCKLCREGKQKLIAGCPEEHTCPLWPYRLNNVFTPPSEIPAPSPTAFLTGIFIGGDAWTIHIPEEGFALVAADSQGGLVTIIDWPEQEGRQKVHKNVKRVCEDFLPLQTPVALYDDITLENLKQNEPNRSEMHLNLRDFSD